MNVKITIHTDNGPDVTIEPSRYEHTAWVGIEVDIKALDTLIATAVGEARAAFGIPAAEQGTPSEGVGV